MLFPPIIGSVMALSIADRVTVLVEEYKRAADMAVTRKNVCDPICCRLIKRWAESETSSKDVFFSYAQEDIVGCSDILAK